MPALHSRARPCPYLGAKAFGEILHAAQGGTQVDIVAVQEDAQQGMGGTGIGDQLESNTKTNLTSRNKTAFQQPLSADNNQVKALKKEPSALVREQPDLSSHRKQGNQHHLMSFTVPPGASAHSAGHSLPALTAFPPTWSSGKTLPGKRSCPHDQQHQCSLSVPHWFPEVSQETPPTHVPPAWSPPGEQRTCY